MRFTLIATALIALSACSPRVPDSGAGVGFKDYNEYKAQQEARDAALAGVTAVPPASTVSDESVSSNSSEPAALAAETTAALAATSSNSGQAPLQANPNNPPPRTVSTTTGISTENDFDAVGEARSIESDAALIAQNREQYEVVQPTALPTRSGNTGPNIVEYALTTSHPVGSKVYNRIGINKDARFRRNCAKYASPDRAQADFLARGGPNRDRLGLDPDGDGYACAWNPEPFRKAVSG